MITLRKNLERGTFHNDWLKSHHTFSFAEYYDPNHMNFKHLRVINEDFIAVNSGFPSHDHHDMEIMTYMISGELEHKDSMGNTSIIKPGEIQFMRAGTLVTHSEFNPSPTTPTHLLQIWIIPHTKNLSPEYHQKLYTREDKLNKLLLIASPDGRDHTFKIAQNVAIYATILTQDKLISYDSQNSTGIWIQVVTGTIDINGITASSGDGVAISDEKMLSIKVSSSESEFILFDFC